MLQRSLKAVADFGHAARNMQDAEIQAFAAKTLPVLQEHLKWAQEIAAQTTAGGSDHGWRPTLLVLDLRFTPARSPGGVHGDRSDRPGGQARRQPGERRRAREDLVPLAHPQEGVDALKDAIPGLLQPPCTY